jgi:MFS family permease
VNSGEVLAIQVLDGLANGLFAVIAGAWVTDRLGDPRRVGTAQAVVGVSLVSGSAVGPLLAGLVVDDLGYRGMFGLLAADGAAATAVVVFGVPSGQPPARFRFPRITRTAFSVRPVVAATSASVSPASSIASSSSVHGRYFGLPHVQTPSACSLAAVARARLERRFRSAADRSKPCSRTASARSLTSWWSRFEPSVPQWATPNSRLKW